MVSSVISEEKAKKILTELGWMPQQIKGYTNHSGYPDFSCSDNRFVEVKRITANYHIQITMPQLERWDELISNGNKVFLIIFSSKNEYLMMFEIKNYKLKKDRRDGNETYISQCNKSRS